MTEPLAEWSRFIDGLEAGESMPEVILESWSRSERAGVARDEVGFRFVADADLERRLQANAQWLDIARSHVEWLSKAFKHVQHVAYVTDGDGIVLASAGDPGMMETFRLDPGCDWSEAAMGTNGAGTALADGRPVAVVGSQHYVDAFADCTCTGAPVHGPDGSVIGALDISTSARDASPERLFTVSHAAYAIGRALALRESEARYSSTEERLLAALSASDAGTFRWDPRTGCFLDFDESLKRLLGISPGDRVEVAEDWVECIHPDDRAAAAAATERSRHGEDFEMEFRVILPDGSTRWLFERAKMTRDGMGRFGHLVGACIDITARKAVEEALVASHRQAAESEGRLATALDVAALGVWELDFGTGMVRGDERWAEIVGVPAGTSLSVDELSGLIHPDDRKRMGELMSGVTTTGSDSFEAEHRVLRRDGSCGWIVVRGREVGSNPGDRIDLRRFLGTVMDVTEQRQSQELLSAALEREREATALLDAIFTAAPIGIGFWDRELRFRRVNPLLAQMNGLPADDHVGKRPDELFQEIEQLEELLVQWRRVIETGEPLLNVEVRGQTRAASGREGIWMEDFFPVRIGEEVIGLGAVIEDITDRRCAEEALRESEQRYRTLFNSMDEGFCVIERIRDDRGRPDFRYLEANPAFGRQAGIGDVVGRTIREVVPDEADGWNAIYDRVLETGEATRFERPLVTSGRTLEVYAYRVEDESRRRVAVVFADVTERRRAEEALRQADRAKDEFLAVLGHELRNPLAPLRTGLDLLEHASSRPKLLDSLRPMMDRQLSHLVRLVDDLLDISRISRGKIELQRAPLDLNAPVEAAVEQVRTMMAEHRHDFVVDLSQASLPVSGDFERLTQVVANLLSNACRYTEPGGTVTVRSGTEDDHAVVRVADTGYGIPPERFDKLFKLFSQIPEHHAHTGGGGLGIGLALARQLMEMHGGSIEAHSEGLGRGSEFVVRVPADHGEASAGADTGSDAARGPTRRVLVVDDNADAADGLRMLLEIQGHIAQAVLDGPAALHQMAHFQPEVVLLDLGLPGMDGVEVARHIRAQPDGDAVLLIAVTGWGQDDDRQRTAEAGFDAHLTKPIEWDQIAPILGRPALPG